MLKKKRCLKYFAMHSRWKTEEIDNSYTVTNVTVDPPTIHFKGPTLV